MMTARELMFQWNVQGFETSKKDVLKIISEFTLNVLAIQETFYRENNIEKIAGYNVAAIVVTSTGDIMAE